MAGMKATAPTLGVVGLLFGLASDYLPAGDLAIIASLAGLAMFAVALVTFGIIGSREQS
jgi:hypothetical protein